MKRISEFLEENSGQFSMTRLMSLVACLCASWVTVNGVGLAMSGRLDFDYLTFVGMVWMLAFAGKHAGKYMEKIK